MWIQWLVTIDVEVRGEGTGKGWRDAHNDVRGDDVVVVREKQGK